MTRENRDIKLDEVLEELYSLRDENSFLKRQNTALKMRCSNYCLKVKDLENEIADLRFTHNYLTSEEAGKAFARELLGKPMTHEEVIISEAENGHVPYTAEDF
jgi:hypothetical protein